LVLYLPPQFCADPSKRDLGATAAINVDFEPSALEVLGKYGDACDELGAGWCNRVAKHG
jgi:hypothetical protein